MKKLLVAHRGASAYAPEHTGPAYRLAIAQGADYVEQDLAATRDGVLICLHDASLERTTNVREVFPDRWTATSDVAGSSRTWLANDFPLKEIKRLDAGAWFGAAFAGQPVLTFEEAIELIGGRAGLVTELKDPEFYARRGVDLAGLVERALRAHHLLAPSDDGLAPVILQTFSAAMVGDLAARGLGLPLALLIEDEPGVDWTRRRVLDAKANGATSLGPDRTLIIRQPELVAWAHEAGMRVVPYTFRAGQVPDVSAEMAHALYALGVDGVITDNPDLFPRR